MHQHSSTLSMFLTLASFILGAIGFVFGYFFMISDIQIGILMLVMTAMFSIILYALSRMVLMLGEIKASLQSSPTYPNIKEYIAPEEETIDSSSNTEDIEGQEWSLKEEERASIYLFYENINKKIEDIIVTPYHKYCVVKAEDFIDVVELIEGQPITMTRSQVEEIPALRKWIQDELFTSKEVS
ncbi:hypothetical protein [Bacillus solimangrovi]|uniref:Uncharacterized protein n=1 Tax=Bacillus solimangrovi TaxID=1305675 RepID=A0A1E5LFS9_9BACI|nr:hypothetical protein [Bacillus solimangrovi]OEH92945.1 hypothetical protein BFG57_14320 [Bacillus solimangrovi]